MTKIRQVVLWGNNLPEVERGNVSCWRSGHGVYVTNCPLTVDEGQGEHQAPTAGIRKMGHLLPIFLPNVQIYADHASNTSGNEARARETLITSIAS